MPAFFYISGYLLDIEKLNQTNFICLCKKYWHRMLRQWFVAWLIYSTYILYIRDEVCFISFIEQIYTPYYHLWFIPSLFSCIVLIYFVHHIIKNKILIYIFLAIISMTLFSLNNSNFRIEGFISCHMLIYVLLGIISKQIISTSLKGGVSIIILYIITTVIIYISGMQFDAYRYYLQLPLCTILCIWGFLPIIREQKIHFRTFELWGKYSLEIYLWHVIPIIMLKYLFINEIVLYNIVSIISLIILSAITFNIIKQQ